MDQSPLHNRNSPIDFAAFRDRIAGPRPQFPTRQAHFVRTTRRCAVPPVRALSTSEPIGSPLKHLGLLVAVLLAVMIVTFHATVGPSLAAPQPAPHTQTAATPAAAPPAAPNLMPAPAPGTPVDYPWMVKRANGLPVTWPCGPIHYRLALDGAPVGAPQLVSDALDRISAVSGYQFRADPPVERVAGEDISYAGIDIAWVSGQDFAGAENRNAIGSGGGAHEAGGAHYTHGTVQLLRDWRGNMHADFEAKDAGPVLLHELGHALGLGHTNDPSAIMYPTEMGISKWSPPERAALQYLHQSCG